MFALMSVGKKVKETNQPDSSYMCSVNKSSYQFFAYVSIINTVHFVITSLPCEGLFHLDLGEEEKRGSLIKSSTHIYSVYMHTRMHRTTLHAALTASSLNVVLITAGTLQYGI